MKVIYLSGPMTGYPQLNFPAFNLAAARLRVHGLTVMNPAELCPDGGTWAACMRADIRALCECDTIVMLPGWEKSNGAHLELQLAHRLEMDIQFLGPLLARLQQVKVEIVQGTPPADAAHLLVPGYVDVQALGEVPR